MARAPVSLRGNLPVWTLGETGETWGLARHTVWMLLGLPFLIVALAVAIIVVDEATFWALTEEDAIVEWLQVAFLVVAAVAGFRYAVGVRGSGSTIGAVLIALGSLAILFIVGEEVSWGQRIFGWLTPEGLSEANAQGETNLHNLAIAEAVLRGGQLAVALYAVFVPLAAALVRPPTTPFLRAVVPPLALVTWFVPLLVYWLARLPLVPSALEIRASEIPELIAFAGFALVSILGIRRVRLAAGGVGAPAVDRDARGVEIA